MLDLSPSREVLELCQEHGLGNTWLEISSCPDELLDRALEECANLSACHGKISEASLLELRGLVLLALQARDSQRASTGSTAAPTDEPADGRRSERMNAFFDDLGALCHKINNPLTSLMGRSQILGRKVRGEVDSPLSKEAQVIEESTKRVVALMQELSHLAAQARAEILGDVRPR